MLIWRSQRSRTVILGVSCAVFIVCSVLPVAHLLVTTFSGASGAHALLLDGRQRGLLYNTTVLGLGTGAMATAFGAPLGVVFARVPLRRKALLRLLAVTPILLPPYVVALAWLSLGSRLGVRGLPAATLVLSLVLYPVSMLATEMAMRRIDGRLEEAALMVAPPHRVLWRITLPLVAPTIIAAALIIFVLAVSEFGVPGLLGVRVYTTEVFTAFAALYDFGRAMALAAPLLLVCVVVAVAATWLLRDRTVTTRRSLGVSPIVFSAWRAPGTAAVLLISATSVALPVLVLAREALSARSLTGATTGATEAIANSLLLAGAGATATIAFSVWLGHALARATRTLRLAGQALLVVLFGIPSTIVGVGLIGVWNRPGPFGTLYGTHAMFLLVYLARYLPIATLMVSAMAQAISTSHEEAAAVSGASWLRTIRRIVMPQLAMGIATAWIVVFVLAFGELGASILVAPPGEATLPIRIYTLIANTSPSDIAILALFQALVIFLPMAALGAYASWREVR